jgi:hypothetical protein
MNKIISAIIIVAVFALIGLALCYFVLKLPIVTGAIDNLQMPEMNVPTLASVGGIGGAAGVAGLAVNAYGKAKSVATSATQQLTSAKTELNSIKNQVSDVKATADAQIQEANKIKTDAAAQIKTAEDKAKLFENQNLSLSAQNQQLQDMLNGRPVQIIKETVVK